MLSVWIYGKCASDSAGYEDGKRKQGAGRKKRGVEISDFKSTGDIGGKLYAKGYQ